MLQISIILVAPQMGENIGAAARAMKNFAVSDLRIVAPRDGWPNERAVAMAVGAVDIVHNAKVYSNLKEAVSDLECIYATVAQHRDMNKEYIEIRDLRDKLDKSSKIGIMFGRESSGLNNEEICLANKIITIGTNPNFSSLNIAQAVMLICYELFNVPSNLELGREQELASHQELEHFFDHLFTELDQTKFFKTPDKRGHMVLNIRNIFSRIENLSKNELQSLRGIITCLSKK